MPPSRLSTGSSSRRRSGFAATPAKTIQIPLNDDTAEKAKRHKRRTILQDMQMNKIAAAVTPGSRRVTLSGDRGESPLNTPSRGGAGAGGELEAVTPMRKVPILANFEEWMKLATDNKINATNSWNFALIDYFYDMSLLKEGEGINFQKASCTLDGCVKIYTNRVDSVATETGKLLSGLADSSSRKKGRGGDDEEDGSDAEAEDGDGNGEGVKRPRRKAQRSSEATLAKDFHTLQIKKLELEFSVDPLFKKASADFDEGGAKGLLLNHLSIDNNGKIVFDSSDDKKAEEEEEEIKEEEDEDEDGTPKPKPAPEEKAEEPEDEDIPIDISVLAARFFPDLSRLDNQDICPSLKGFEFGDSAGALDIPFLKALEERADEELQDGDDGASDNGGDMAFGFDDGYGVGVESDGLGFGEGGEVWANETIADAAERFMSPAKRPTMMGLGGADGEEERFGEVDGDYRVGFGDSAEGILSYFDEALKKNWAGPEHWRIRKIKDSTKSNAAPVRVRKEKETFEIDFMDPAGDIPADVFAPPKARSATTLPKRDQQPKSRYLLPDDKLFNSRQLLKLFLKPKSSIQETKRRRLTLSGGRAAGTGNTTTHDIPADADPAGEDMDEEFWAKENMAMEIQASSTPDPKVAGNYDANFFQDDGGMGGMGLGGLPDDDDDDDEFADAREAFSPGPEGAAAQAGATQNVFGTQQFPPGTFGGNLEFGSQLVTGARRVRPEYVQYARVAKKVDVRKLKENLWTGLAFEPPSSSEVLPGGKQAAAVPPPEEPRRFTRVMNELQSVYPQKTMGDISTSYCFICLLHLANEKGLVITGSEALTELSVVKDESAEGPDGY
ncbi:uncharacterized protein LAJ45_08583 [Morchella importuna]|uniref:uncharacterized protein n=1 Tax=Morchella importuna TaxID=1174673 RepID=UPI001E8D1BA1|nr:uncharacterized protein LAJ45_08583 [Morchella importuna]KAH8147427.1 hypothetical protein LAJ45_08583 [Morchella importuna]